MTSYKRPSWIGGTMEMETSRMLLLRILTNFMQNFSQIQNRYDNDLE